MKICTYCGKEYPDETVSCPIDGQPVTVDGKLPQTPKPLPPPFDLPAHLAARPVAVKFGVGLLAITSLFDDFQWGWKRFRAHSSFGFVDYFTLSFATMVPLLLLYLIFRGKNWARWVALLVLILGTFSLPYSFGRVPAASYVYELIDVIALLALFSRPANEWFTKSKSAPVAPSADSVCPG